MKPRRLAFILTSFAALALATALTWQPQTHSPDTDARSSTAGTSEIQAGSASARPADASSAATSIRTDDFDETAFIADMQARFGPHIHRPHAQVRSIEQLINFLRGRYADDWEQHMHALLQRLFPDLAEQLYARFQSLISYNHFLEMNRAELRRMPAAQRRETLWQARYQAFGPDADSIWAAERRSQALGDALRDIAPDADTSLRLEQYKTALHEIYGEKAPRLLQQRRTELVNRFLEQEPVRAELATMAPERRRTTLREVRTALGMPEAALERWDKLDAQRDQVWRAGEQYMQQREAILARHDAEDAQWRLDALRQSTFGAQAEQIKTEEDAGFFRFAHARRYGRE